MRCKKVRNIYFVRIDRGEEILSELKKVCSENNIKLAKISAIGAVDKAVIGLFEPATKSYHSTTLTGDYEITALLGNVTTQNGEVYIHTHITLADAEHKAFGGHLNEAVVCATCEAIIETYDAEIERVFDEKLGLNLFDI
ncbi:MAG TPA: DNA-binding protein [Candidatus Cloacimonadota bacterium]|nr:DNA-binding protein [Candidatus Cloacimonadota bacterium]